MSTWDYAVCVSVTTTIYVWRRGPVVGWVFAGHLLGDFDEARTLELARKLDSSIPA